MKSTYKLYGSYWDGMSSFDYPELPKEKSFSDNPPTKNLSFVELLTVEDDYDYNSLTSSMVADDEISVTIDFWPVTSNPVLCSFLRKRLCQIAVRLSKQFREV